MKGYCENIETATIANGDFRRVAYTGKHLQLVLMTLQPGDEIGEEVHQSIDQFFRVEEGDGVISIDGVEHRVSDDFAVIVPSGGRAITSSTDRTDLSGSTPCTARPNIAMASSNRPRPKPTSAIRTRSSTAGQPSRPAARRVDSSSLSNSENNHLPMWKETLCLSVLESEDLQT